MQTLQAETELTQQKKVLKQQLKKRTAELKQMQLEEMRQMYRFAELGQLGVALLHDLANHLAALTLEIEDIQSKQRSKDIDRAREIIRYLEDVVENTRDRIHAAPQIRSFNIIKEISNVINFLHFKAAKADVAVEWRPTIKIWKYTGDSARLCQVIAILISNAIDAYAYTKGAPISPVRRVAVDIECSESGVKIMVKDWGKGIAKNARKLLFKPFRGTKKAGLGIGLFIAKQTIETQFKGSLILNPTTEYTEFLITLPAQKNK